MAGNTWWLLLVENCMTKCWKRDVKGTQTLRVNLVAVLRFCVLAGASGRLTAVLVRRTRLGGEQSPFLVEECLLLFLYKQGCSLL